jgi:transcriptional regulator with XRE-family HTH domain
MDPRRAAQIAQLRALGYSQREIASRLSVSQQTVSRYQKGINQAAGEADDLQEFLMGLLILGLGVGAAIALAKLFKG